ncbi:MAG: hypothetical protein ACK40O_02485 [Allosphingosinicella sp.]
MGKLVKLKGSDGQDLYVNSEAVRAVLPASGASFVVYGDTPTQGVAVQGTPSAVAAKMIG